jgi:hypothetical protein
VGPVLFAIGGLTFYAGTRSTATAETTVKLTGIGIMATGGVITAIGIPLLVVGAMRLRAHNTPPKFAPDVRLGFGDAQATWTF